MNKFMFQMMLLEKLNELAQKGIVKATGIDEVFEEIKALVSEFENPNKVIIPRFVAEWLESRKSIGRNLHSTLVNMDDDELVGDWYYNDNDDPIEEKTIIFARAWIEGYEVEQEKLYTVEIPDPNSETVTCLVREDETGKVVIDSLWEAEEVKNGWKLDKDYQFTEAEIKKDFEWAFRWAEEVEE